MEHDRVNFETFILMAKHSHGVFEVCDKYWWSQSPGCSLQYLVNLSTCNEAKLFWKASLHNLYKKERFKAPGFSFPSVCWKAACMADDNDLPSYSFRPFGEGGSHMQTHKRVHRHTLCLLSKKPTRSRAEIHWWRTLPQSSRLWKGSLKAPRHLRDSLVMCSHSYMMKLYLSAGPLT